MLSFLFRHPLARRHLFKVIGRIGHWQFRKRLFPSSPFIVPFIGPTKLALHQNEQAALGNWYYGLSEFEMMGFVLHFLRSSDCFIDIGANIGSYSILSAGVNKAQTIAVEPVPSTFEKLKQNIALNNLEQVVKLYHMGLSDNPGVLQFSTKKGQQNHVVKASESDISAALVEVSTLDKIATNQSPTLLKIDVEGFETKVILGGQQTLKNSELKAVILETMGLGNRYGFDERELHQKMEAFGFKAFEYNPFERKLAPVIQSGDQTLYLRDVEGVRERIKMGKPFVVLGERI